MNLYPYPVVDEHFVQPPHINPYSPTIEEAKELAQRLEEAAQCLMNAIAGKHQTAQQLDQAKKLLADVEASIVFYKQMDAARGEGPLKGIATSSKAYTLAVDGILAQAALNDSPSGSAQCHERVRAASEAYNAALIEYEQAETRYQALKYKAQLLTAILNASRG